MTSRLFKIMVLLAVTSFVAGCKLEVVAVQGGDVAWNGGSCPEGSNCVIEITDPNYANTFTVTPKPGYEFVKWRKAPGFLCGDSTSLTCTFTMPADANVAAAVISLFITGHIMPIYKDVGIDTDGDGIRNELDPDDDNDGVLDADDACPLVGPNLDGFGCPTLVGTPITGSDIVIADSKEWTQADLFINLSWDQINAVCPAGVCGNEELNGHSMYGWTWASVDDVDALFNFYGVSPPFVGVGDVSEHNSLWAPAFFSGGWRPTTPAEGQRLQAWISELYPIWDDLGMLIDITDYPFSTVPGELDRVVVGAGWDRSAPGSEIGAVFYREIN